MGVELRILEAAKAEFEERGFDGTCLKGIGARSGLNEEEVLAHFESKDEMCHGALFYDLEAVCNSAAHVEPGSSLIDDYVQFASRIFDYFNENPDLVRVLIRKTMFADGPWKERLTGQVFGVHATLTQWAEKAVEDGRLRSETDPALVATTFLAFYYFTLIGWMQEAAPDPIAMIRGLMENHLAGLKA